jgi:hypothetical protein
LPRGALSDQHEQKPHPFPDDPTPTHPRLTFRLLFLRANLRNIIPPITLSPCIACRLLRQPMLKRREY